MSVTVTESFPNKSELSVHGRYRVKDKSSKKIPPVVRSIYTDVDLGLIQKLHLENVDLEKLIKLLIDPHSCHLYDRHAHAIQKLTRVFPLGFLLKDLPKIFKVLDVCADRFTESSLYLNSILGILQICELPFLLNQSSDTLLYKEVSIQCVSQLGYLLRIPHPDVKIQICRTVLTLYTNHYGLCSKRHSSLQACTDDFLRILIEDSDCIESFVKTLSLVKDELRVRVEFCKVLQVMSQQSISSCLKILSVDGGNLICSSMLDTDPSGQILFRSVDILWNLLELGDSSQLSQQLSHQQCISNLKEAFLQQITQGYSHYDRQLRNDLLVISSLVAGNVEYLDSSTSPFVSLGYTKQLVLFATFQEVKSHNALVRHFKLTTNPEDFELKKLLVNILVTLASSDPSSLPIMIEGHLLLGLMSYLKPNEVQTRKRKPDEWSEAQFEELQLVCMDALCTISPLMIETYMTCNGNTRALMMLDWCLLPDDFAGQGNSFHGTGGRGNKRSQMRYCVRMLRSVVGTEDATVLQDLTDQNAIDQLTRTCHKISQDDSYSDMLGLELQTDIMYILSILCDTDIHQKELFGNPGTDLCLHYLKLCPPKLSTGLGYNRLLLTAIDTIWSCIFGSDLNEDYFLEKEGMFLLFDFLETSLATNSGLQIPPDNIQVCPASLRNMVLGCILDLCENPKCVPHIITWRGDGGRTATHLLCELWRQEESVMAVARNNDGTIADTVKPMMGELQEKQGAVPLPSKLPSAAIVDVSENIRSKIYGLFLRLGMGELFGLTAEDHVTLPIIERYMDFKVSEVWSELMCELEAEEVKPVAADQEALQLISRGISEKTIELVETQKEIIDAHNERELADEREFYTEIRERQKQRERAFAYYQDYIARTSKYNILKEARYRQQSSIAASRTLDATGPRENFHKTALTDLHVTAFSGRHVTVESTPGKITGRSALIEPGNTDQNDERKLAEAIIEEDDYVSSEVS